MESHKNSKYKEKFVDVDIDDLIEKKENELLVNQQKVDEIEQRLFLLNISEDKDSESLIKKVNGKFSLTTDKI